MEPVNVDPWHFRPSLKRKRRHTDLWVKRRLRTQDWELIEFLGIASTPGKLRKQHVPPHWNLTRYIDPWEDRLLREERSKRREFRQSPDDFD